MPATKFVEEILAEFEDLDWEHDTISDFLQEFIESRGAFTAEDFRTFLQQQAKRENREAVFEYCPSCRGRSLTKEGSPTHYSTEDGQNHILLQEFQCTECNIAFWAL